MAKQTTLIEINGKFYPSTVEVPDEPIVDNRTYDEKVVALIREKYTIDQEFAILRQRYTKPDEFLEYDIYCENCKLRAKSENI